MTECSFTYIERVVLTKISEFYARNSYQQSRLRGASLTEIPYMHSKITKNPQ